MPADLSQLFDLGRISALQSMAPLWRMADHLTLGEMMEMLEEVTSGLHPRMSMDEGNMGLSELQWTLLHRIARMGTLPPWEENMQKSAAVLDELGYLVAVPVQSDNLAGGGGFLRCLLTPKGYKVLSLSRLDG